MNTILLVDDMALMHRLLGLMLDRTSNQYNLVTTSNPQNVLAQLESTAVDLIITDINMPGMNGLDLLKRIRADARYANTPVIVLTANASERVRTMATQIGANGFLTKPTSTWELQSTIQQHLQAQQTLPLPVH